MARVSRFKKRESDRSGFDFLEIGLVKQPNSPFKVGSEELDTPPPSKRSLGGEGDIAGEPRASSDFADGIVNVGTAAGFGLTTHLITATGITPSFANVVMLVAGTTNPIDITSDPQIAVDRHGKVLTLHCTSNGITLDEGTGLQLIGSVGYTMNSGTVMTLIFDTGNTVWIETSRNPGEP